MKKEGMQENEEKEEGEGSGLTGNPGYIGNVLTMVGVSGASEEEIAQAVKVNQKVGADVGLLLR